MGDYTSAERQRRYIARLKAAAAANTPTVTNGEQQDDTVSEDGCYIAYLEGMLEARGVDLLRARRRAASVYHCPSDVTWKDWIEGEGRQYEDDAASPPTVTNGDERKGLQKLLDPNASKWATDDITCRRFCNWFEDEIVEGRMSPYLVETIGSGLSHLAKRFADEKPLECKPREYKTDRGPPKWSILPKGRTVKLNGTKGLQTVIEDPGPTDQQTRLVKLQPRRGKAITGRRDWIYLK